MKIRFVKKRIEVDAMRVTEGLCRAWAERPGEAPAGILVAPGEGTVHVDTSNGPSEAKVGDWLILDVSGRWYPCTDEIFCRTYDPVAESEHQRLKLRQQLGMDGEPTKGWKKP